MAQILKTDEVFNHLLVKTNLFKEALAKEDEDSFSHSIDEFEKFISFCKNPDLLFKMLIIISPQIED